MMLLYSYRRSQSGFDSPSLNIESCPNSAGMQAGKLSPLANGFSLSSKSKQSITYRIISLIFCAHPFTINGFVIAIVICTLNGILSGRPFPHVCQKILELQPPFTNLNTTSSVSVKSSTLWISAACQHVRPSSMSRTTGHAMCDGLNTRIMPATTTNSRSIAQPFAGIKLGLAAITPAQPLHSSLRRSFRMQSNNEKHSKTLAFHIFNPSIHGCDNMTAWPVYGKDNFV